MTEGVERGAGGLGEGESPWVELDLGASIWERFYTPSPLVLIGTREGDGYDLAPKHMAFPMGWENYFGFVCTPNHSTYHNVIEWEGFGVSYPRPDQLLLTSLAALGRDTPPGAGAPGTTFLPVEAASSVEGVLLQGAYAQIECTLERIVDGFGPNSLIIGRACRARISPDALRSSEIDDGDLVRRAPLLTYLYPGRYGIIGETHPFPFPADFRK